MIVEIQRNNSNLAAHSTGHKCSENKETKRNLYFQPIKLPSTSERKPQRVPTLPGLGGHLTSTNHHCPRVLKYNPLLSQRGSIFSYLITLIAALNHPLASTHTLLFFSVITFFCSSHLSSRISPKF